MAEIEELLSRKFGRSQAEDADLLSSLVEFFDDESKTVEDRARALVHSHTDPDSEPCSYEDALAELKSEDVSIDVSGDDYRCTTLHNEFRLQAFIIYSEKYIAVVSEYDARVASRYCLVRWGSNHRVVYDIENCPKVLFNFLKEDIDFGYGYHEVAEFTDWAGYELTPERLKQLEQLGV